jgi:hypothetical protein
MGDMSVFITGKEVSAQRRKDYERAMEGRPSKRWKQVHISIVVHKSDTIS